VFSTAINSRTKEYCVRSVAAALALLFLISTAVTPATIRIWGATPDSDIITVPYGTSLEDLPLPDTIDITVTFKQTDDESPVGDDAHIVPL